MPYISAEARERLDPHIQELADEISRLADAEGDDAAFAGFLNYSCTKLALKVMPVRRYWSIATVIGVFRNVADEFYRRVGVPYEDEKLAEHGDVY
ncbi:MAG: DUF6899 family protein [Solirubrobacteraceae bacterium]